MSKHLAAKRTLVSELAAPSGVQLEAVWVCGELEKLANFFGTWTSTFDSVPRGSLLCWPSIKRTLRRTEIWSGWNELDDEMRALVWCNSGPAAHLEFFWLKLSKKKVYIFLHCNEMGAPQWRMARG